MIFMGGKSVVVVVVVVGAADPDDAFTVVPDDAFTVVTVVFAAAAKVTVVFSTVVDVVVGCTANSMVGLKYHFHAWQVFVLQSAGSSMKSFFAFVVQEYCLKKSSKLFFDCAVEPAWKKPFGSSGRAEFSKMRGTTIDDRCA